METQCCKNTTKLSTNEQYWDNQYKTKETGWDLNQVSPPIKAYINQLENRDISILIAGCGNAYEAEYLYNNGFKNITLVDIAETLVNSLKQKFKNTTIEILHKDIFEHTGKYDLILEQTLFCAIAPSLRKNYVSTMYNLLKEGGKLVGLLFNKEFEKKGPPFGGTEEEYKTIFEPYFTINTLKTCYNSIEKRRDNELFIIFKK